LPEDATPRAHIHRAALLKKDVLHFTVDSCLADLQILAFARFWNADAAEDILQSECGFEGLPPVGTSRRWRLSMPCKYVHPYGELAAIQLVNKSLAARRSQLSGGSLGDDEQLLAGLSNGVRRDAVVVRRDEKYVLGRIESWLQRATTAVDSQLDGPSFEL